MAIHFSVLRSRRTFRHLVLAVVLLVAAGPLRAAEPGWIRSLEPASTGGVATLDRALARLSENRRLLMVAAHPDDEDSRLLALVARGLGGEAAYLSLSRGEGGQNLIGAELGVGLGLIRSRELEAARRLDGARQYFSRAFDFGYTRSIEETLSRWPEDILLEDAVRVIRSFKPQIVIAIFPPDARAGHGQHQASGMIARRAFDEAGRADAFAALAQAGLPPFAPTRFDRAAWWNPDGASLALPLDQLDAESGRSILQVSLASRSQHRSQDMGLEQPLGYAETQVTFEAGRPRPADADGLFAGIDTRLSAIVAPLRDGEAKTACEADLARVASLARSAREVLTPARPEAVVGPLGEIVDRLSATRARLTGTDDASVHARALVDEKLVIASEALAAASGVVADAIADRETVVAGETLTVRVQLWRSGGGPVDDTRVELVADPGWTLQADEQAEPSRGRFATRLPFERRLTVDVGAGVPPTVPYFLERPRQRDHYDWSSAPESARGRPFARPPLGVRFHVTLGGRSVTLEREVVHRYRDQAYGERRRPLRVVPRLGLAVQASAKVWSVNRQPVMPVDVEVRRTTGADDVVQLEVVLPEGMRLAQPPPEIRFDGAQRVWRGQVELVADEMLSPGQYRVAFSVLAADGARFAIDDRMIDYEHIRPTVMPVAAEIALGVGHVELPALGPVGYVRGASDRVPEALRGIGVPVEVLGARELAEADLSRYEVIVIGARAYETDAALVAANDRLLGWVRRGGRMIVQYQQYQFVRGGFAPFPLDIARPHDRTTDEEAPVRVLVPDHPVFDTPNRIAERDWSGWVQERGLYFARDADAAYRPLLAMPDPEGVERDGVLLVAQLGEGTYVYTGIAFFRQLPAGVVGAYRLFANLLAWGAS